MNHKYFIFLFVFVLMLSLGIFERVFSCSCVKKTPCNIFEKADVVFVGKVVEIRKEGELAFGVYFEVSEAFKGVKIGAKVKIMSVQNDGGGCGYRFENDEVSLVYGRNSVGPAEIKGLWTYQCSGNKPLEYAEESINFLRSFLSESSETVVVGNIEDISSGYINQTFPLENIKIKAQRIGNKKQVFYGTTDKEGFYEIKVPIGTYLITPELSEDYIFGEFDSKENKPLKVEKLKCNGKFFLAIKSKK